MGGVASTVGDDILHSMKERNSTSTLVLFCVAVLGLGGGLLFGYLFFGKEASPSAPLMLTNPNLAQGPIRESFTINERQKLTAQLLALLEQEKKTGTVSEASIYFRDLNNGPWLGINEDLKFSPASLLKVPLAIAYYHAEENTPDVLTQEIEFMGPRGVTVAHYPPREPLQEQRVYTVRDLIERMLEDSDNDATAILGQYLPIEQTQEVYKDLGVQTVTDYDTYTIDVRTYASFLRILFNASYLSQKSSEEVLDILTHSRFTEGLQAGVPSDIKIAHKFGERTIDEARGFNQLHDCGIVYVPQRPYILCVMTQGKSYEQLAAFIEEVSRQVYSAILSSKNSRK